MYILLQKRNFFRFYPWHEQRETFPIIKINESRCRKAHTCLIHAGDAATSKPQFTRRILNSIFFFPSFSLSLLSTSLLLLLLIHNATAKLIVPEKMRARWRAIATSRWTVRITTAVAARAVAARRAAARRRRACSRRNWRNWRYRSATPARRSPCSRSSSWSYSSAWRRSTSTRSHGRTRTRATWCATWSSVWRCLSSRCPRVYRWPSPYPLPIPSR